MLWLLKQYILPVHILLPISRYFLGEEMKLMSKVNTLRVIVDRYVIYGILKNSGRMETSVEVRYVMLDARARDRKRHHRRLILLYFTYCRNPRLYETTCSLKWSFSSSLHLTFTYMLESF